jgi:hypothetical protein
LCSFRLPPAYSLEDKTVVGMGLDTSSTQVAVPDITVGENKADLPSRYPTNLLSYACK